MLRTVHLSRLGLCPYDAAMRWQAASVAALRSGGGGERLALLEHRPVFTLGRRARYEHLLANAPARRLRDAGVVETDRGGDVTFHGPGQLVAYPVLDLRDRGLGPVDYVRALEETLIETLARLDVRGERSAGRPGVWAGGEKLACVGVRVRGGVSSHGVALNLTTDLSWFDAIVPCGLEGVRMTSVERVLGRAPNVSAAEEAFIEAFAIVFGSEVAAAERPATGVVASLSPAAAGAYGL